MIPLDLSARRDDWLSADSWVLEPHQIGFAGHFHLPGPSSASWTSCYGALAKGNMRDFQLGNSRTKSLDVTKFDRKSGSRFLRAPVAEADLEPSANFIVLRLRNPYQEGRTKIA